MTALVQLQQTLEAAAATANCPKTVKLLCEKYQVFVSFVRQQDELKRQQDELNSNLFKCVQDIIEASLADYQNKQDTEAEDTSEGEEKENSFGSSQEKDDKDSSEDGSTEPAGAEHPAEDYHEEEGSMEPAAAEDPSEEHADEEQDDKDSSEDGSTEPAGAEDPAEEHHEEEGSTEPAAAEEHTEEESEGHQDLDEQRQEEDNEAEETTEEGEEEPEQDQAAAVEEEPPSPPANNGPDPDMGFTNPCSWGHHEGNCRRCAFFYQPNVGCNNGDDCGYCHYPHDKRHKKRAKGPKPPPAQLSRTAQWLPSSYAVEEEGPGDCLDNEAFQAARNAAFEWSGQAEEHPRLELTMPPSHQAADPWPAQGDRAGGRTWGQTERFERDFEVQPPYHRPPAPVQVQQVWQPQPIPLQYGPAMTEGVMPAPPPYSPLGNYQLVPGHYVVHGWPQSR